jgi:hypothetical protein
MKKIKLTCGLFCLLFISSEINAQITNPPPLVHREITWATQAPSGPAVFENNSFFVGEGNPTNQFQSGEDWWYDTRPIKENGIHTGYIVVGFTTYKNMHFSEDQFMPRGFVNELVASNLGDPNYPNDACSRIVGFGESVSGYRQVISRFDLKGKMVWCKPLNYDNALRSVIQAPDGSFYAIGESAAGYKYGANPIPYMYNPTDPVQNPNNVLPLVEKVVPADLNFLGRYNRTRVLVYHFDSNGDVLWSNLYGDADFPDPINQTVRESNSTLLEGLHLYGLDLNISSNGDLVIVGQKTDGRIFTAKIDPITGYLLEKNLTQTTKPHYVKKMDCLNGSCYVVGGTIEPDESRKSFVYKFDDNTLSSSSWTNNPTYLGLSLTFPNPPNSILTDIIVETNELVVVGLDKTQGDAFGSGDNFGIGKIGKIDLNGNLTQIVPFNNPEGTIGAFDLKIGLTKTNDLGYALVTSVPGSYNFDTPQNQQVILDYKNSISPSNCSNLFDQGLTWNTDTYVAKFDQNLNKLWETSFDSDDKNPVNYPGDIKKQECMYSIAEATDGKLFVVGNSSHNSDDYYAALLESDCQHYVTYDYPIPTPQVPNPTEFLVLPNTTLTWNSPKKVKGIIRVYENALLRIENTTIEIANSGSAGMETKFIIEKGGRIEIVNSTLTCIQSCGKQFWDGIVIEGEYWANQTNANQGSILIDNSTIEYAREALTPGKYNDWVFNGGIITAVNSNFINNNRSVQYLTYQNKVNANSPEINNLGSFTNCTFKWTDEFLNDAPQPAITIFRNKGIRIQGCTFDDQRSASIPLENRARGIFTIDAGYFVKGKVIAGLPPAHSYFSTSNYDVGEFINMYKGIENLNGGSLKPFVVDHVRFINCQYGVVVSGTDNAMITRNEFNYSDNAAPYYKPFLLPSSGRQEITLNRASAYNVEGNHFYNDKNENTYGCVITNSGIEENKVRKNKFTNLNLANAAFRKNRAPSIIDVKGLQYLCNTNTSNAYDMYIYSTSPLNAPIEGVRLDQGAPSQATLNSVTQNLMSNNFNFTTNDGLSLRYFYNAPAEIPVTQGLVNSFPANPGAFCPSKLNIFEISHPSTVLLDAMRSNVQSDLNDAINDEYTLQMTYQSNLNNGNSATLHNSIANISLSSANSVYSALQSASPYLSTSILMELGEVSESIFNHSWYVDLLLDNAELIGDIEFRNYLLSKTTKFGQSELEDIFAACNNTTTLRGEDRAEIGLLTSNIEELRNALLLDYLVSDDQQDQDDLPVLISDRAHYAYRAELVDYWMGREEYTNALSELNELTNELGSMPYATVNSELQDFVSFKDYLLNKLIGNSSFLTELSQTDIDELLGMRNELAGKASLQASNILCFYAGICEEIEWFEITQGKHQAQTNQNNSVFATAETVSYAVYPNPTHNSFVIKGSGKASIQEVEIYNLLGQRVATENTTISKTEVKVNLNEQQKGVYLVRIKDQNGTIETVRLIKN